MDVVSQIGLELNRHFDVLFDRFHSLGLIGEKVAIDNHLGGFRCQISYHPIQLPPLVEDYNFGFCVVLDCHFDGLLDLLKASQEVLYCERIGGLFLLQLFQIRHVQRYRHVI